MLTVWCLWWRDPAEPDKYSEYYVRRLRNDVLRNLHIPHRFICVTDQYIDDIETMQPQVDWPGWWGKLDLFRHGTTYNLYLDLDVVITGDLNELVERYKKCTLAMPWNWAQSGHGGCQSSVMMWRGTMAHAIGDRFNPKDAHWPPKNEPGVLWGDQEFITVQRDAGFPVTQINPDWVKSYKYHCRQGLPEGAKVVVFHGKPKPSEVSVPWFRW